MTTTATVTYSVTRPQAKFLYKALRNRNILSSKSRVYGKDQLTIYIPSNMTKDSVNDLCAKLLRERDV